jgi:hypothetical protein
VIFLAVRLDFKCIDTFLLLLLLLYSLLLICNEFLGTGYRAANINLSNVLSCGLDGGLADTEFQCDPLPCDVEPNILFADLTIESCVGTQSFETCAFYCEPGFHPSGEISCSLGNWNMDAHCVPDDCSGSPTKIDNMDQFMCTGTVPSGTACEYTCLPGYIRSSDVVVCSEGRWQDRRVTCEYVASLSLTHTHINTLNSLDIHEHLVPCIVSVWNPLCQISMRFYVRVQVLTMRAVISTVWMDIANPVPI